MKGEVIKKLSVLVICLSLLCLSASRANAEKAKLEMRIDECKDLLEEVMQMPDKSIPSKLLREARGIAIFPSVIKGGFIFGGRYGQGLVLYHDKNTDTWSAPSFYTIAGGKLGAADWRSGYRPHSGYY